MRVERLRPAELGERRFACAIVIDVLRATSTATVLFARGIERMLLVATPRELALLHLNPMTAIVVGWQRALLDGAPPEWDALAYAAAFGIVLFVAGFAYFRRAKDGFEAAL